MENKRFTIPKINLLLKWLLIACLAGVLIGSASAFFLTALQWVTDYREANLWIISLLPVGGLLIGYTYHYLGKSVVKGNNLLLEEVHSPKNIIPLRMAPLVLFGTLVTHLFGGSAGREGTAVQMGGAIADQFTKIFKLSSNDRSLLIIMGISAGFASVFGTPLAGAVFAVEVLLIGRMRYNALLPSLIVAYVAHYTCLAWQVSHTQYNIPFIPDFKPEYILYTLAAGLLFGLTAMLFSKSIHFFTNAFKKLIAYPPLRPVLGGAILALTIWAMGTTKYIGLGIPAIQESFIIRQPYYAFAVKLLLTAFTLGAGFKGGEVTPLFFVGAALGNLLFLFIPLPMALLAGMGFVAVFSGATNTPIACTIMGMELFGTECGLYIALSCIIAYLFSGHTGIYSSQLSGGGKHVLFGNFKGRLLVLFYGKRSNN